VRLRGLREFWVRYRRNRLAVVGLAILMFFAFVAAVGPYLAPYTPYQLAGRPFQGPCIRYPMGTDDLGRDIYSQVLYGIRVTLTVGFLAAGLAGLIGVVVGSLAGYFSKRLGLVFSGLIELFQSLPLFFLALVMVALFGAKLWNTILAIGITLWAGTARIQRAQVLSLKEQPFVEAARIIGEGDFSIIFREILPNAIPPAIVNIAYSSSIAILVESGLSFLGLGDPALMSLGYIIGNARLFFYRAWWMGVIPGVILFTIVLSINLVSDGVNDALNPKLVEGR